MSIIYVVVRESSDCLEYHDSNVLASFDKEKCEKYISKTLKENERKKELQTTIKSFDDAWGEHNDWPTKPLIKMPKWPNGLKKEDASPELLAERERINALNEEINEENRRSFEEFSERNHKANIEYIKHVMKITDEAGINEVLELLTTFKDDFNVKFKIKELKVI